MHKSRSVHYDSRFRSHAQIDVYRFIFNCLILNCVYSLQFESPAPFGFLLPALCLPGCTFYGTVFAVSLFWALVSPFAVGGSVVFRAWIFTSTSDWRLKFRLLPDKMFGRHGTHPTLVQKGALPLLQVSCVCCVVGFGVLRAAQRGQVFVEGGLA